MIGIIDYGMGNLRSITNALDHLNIPCKITSDAEELKQCDHLILPGVGSFHDSMQNIHERNLFEPIQQMVLNGKPLLGICLGMQMLYESSSENGYTEGFGFLKGTIDFMEGEERVPEIGWNSLDKINEHPIWNVMSEKPYFYYVHSYCAMHTDENEVIGASQYGKYTVPGLVGKNNILGCQFHPEKSSDDGLAILKYFYEVVK